MAIAGELLQTALTHFADSSGGFFDTADDAELLFTRPHSQGENAEPSGTTALAGALLTYSALSGERRVEAESALNSVGEVARRDPRFAGWALAVAEAALAGPLQVAIVGDDDASHRMVRVARESTSPGLVLAFGDPDAEGQPLLEGRPLIHESSAAYVCRSFVCDLPVTDSLALDGVLRA